MVLAIEVRIGMHILSVEDVGPIRDTVTVKVASKIGTRRKLYQYAAF